MQGRREVWVCAEIGGERGTHAFIPEAVVRMARASGIGPLVARPAAGNGAAGNVLRKIGFRCIGRGGDAADRGTIAPMLFEDSGAAPVPVDSSRELYMDRAPIAA